MGKNGTTKYGCGLLKKHYKMLKKSLTCSHSLLYAA